MEKITAYEANEILWSQEKLFDKIITGKLTITSQFGVNTVSNCTFVDEVVCDYARNIKFSKCRFHSFEFHSQSSMQTTSVELEGCKFESNAGVLIRGSDLISLRIDDCELTAIRLEDAELSRLRVIHCKAKSVNIATAVIHETLTIHHSSIGSIWVVGATVGDQISVEDIDDCVLVQIRDCEADWGRVYGGNVSRVEIFDTTFRVRCEMVGLSLEEGVFLVNVTCNEPMQLRTLESDFSVQDAIQGLPDWNPPSVEIHGGNFPAGLIWTIAPLLQKDGTLGTHDPRKNLYDFTITNSGLGKGIVEVRGVTLRSVLLHGNVGFDLNVIHKCLIMEIALSEYSSKGRCRISNGQWTDVGPNIRIMDSNLGQMEWYGMNLTFSKLIIQASVVTGLVSANVEFPESINSGELFDYREAANQRETYRQLKLAMQRQGNHIQALRFKALEHEAHRAELRLMGNGKNLWDRVLLWTNRSNNHGLSWPKPLLLLLCIHFIVVIPLYSLLLNMYYGHTAFCPSGLMSVLQGQWGDFFVLLNPAHRFDTLLLSNSTSNDSVLNWLKLLDYSYRLVVGYFIFQIVSAFRKYAK